MEAIETSHRKRTSRFNAREKRIKLFSTTNAGQRPFNYGQICVIRIPPMLLNFFSGSLERPVPVVEKDLRLFREIVRTRIDCCSNRLLKITYEKFAIK